MYRRIKELYLYYYPFSERECRKKALLTEGVIVGAGAAGSLLLLAGTERSFAVMLSVFLMYFVYREAFYRISCHEGKREKENFGRVLMNTAHQYYRYGQAAEAVYAASEGMPADTMRNLRRIYEILGAEDVLSAAEDYEKQVSNRFYRSFLMQAASVEEHGDAEIAAKEGNTVFLQGLFNLRLETELAQRNEQRLRYLLSGLGFVIAVPIFTVPSIRRWAVGNLAELSGFYDGIAGRSLELAAYAATFFFYELLNELRGVPYRPLFQKAVRRAAGIRWCRRLFEMCRAFREESFARREEMLKKLGDERDGCEFFLNQLMSAAAAFLLCSGVYMMYLRYGAGGSAVWIFCFPAAVFFGGKYPAARLWIKRFICIDQRKEEVLRLQFLICLEKRLPGMTSIELLEHLEHNARLFRHSLRECIGNYSMDENEAFLTLWQKETEPAFRRLVDMFAMAEEIGVADAFAEIDADVGQLMENQKLEQEITQQRRADFAVLLACVPGMLLLFGYLILPFMAECFRMLEHYNGSLSAV